MKAITQERLNSLIGSREHESSIVWKLYEAAKEFGNEFETKVNLTGEEAAVARGIEYNTGLIHYTDCLGLKSIEVENYDKLVRKVQYIVKEREFKKFLKA